MKGLNSDNMMAQMKNKREGLRRTMVHTNDLVEVSLHITVWCKSNIKD